MSKTTSKRCLTESLECLYPFAINWLVSLTVRTSSLAIQVRVYLTT